MELLRSQKTIEIPPVHLEPNSTIAEFVLKCQEEGKKPDVEGLGVMGHDTSFLNDIQKVRPRGPLTLPASWI